MSKHYSCIYNPSGNDLELDYVADSIFNQPRDNNIFTIRIYGGGHSNIQTVQLKAALKDLNLDPKLYTIEVLTCDDVNVNHYSIKTIVDWLLSASIHFITGHVHQGIQLAIVDSNLSGSNSFTMEALVSELQRLKYHRGFPYGNHLKCPIFLQDKYEYLSILQKHNLCNSTLKVERSSIGGERMDNEFTINKINAFLDNCKEEGCGWVVKLPFVTNQVVKGIKSKDDVIKKIHSIFATDSMGIYPYVMIQPCMKNRKEYKVVYIPKKNILYVANIRGAMHANGKKAFSFGNHEALFAFIKTTVEFFRAECPHAICDGLFRVDVFMNDTKEFVVNEFESMEAGYYGKSELEVTHFLKEYWAEKLMEVDQIKDLIVISAENTIERTVGEVVIRKKRARA